MAYETAGVEPTLEDIKQDPIVRYLRHYDGLPPSDWPELDAGEAELWQEAA